MNQNIAIFCGSALGKDSRYAAEAFRLGQLMAKNHLGVVYGGASVGLMGKVADGALAEGGRVIGIMPRAILSLEVEHKGLTEFHTVESMHERKEKMYSLSAAYLVLPGGLGTLDELFEIATWLQLGHHHCPIIIYNKFDFFSPLRTYLEKVESEGFYSNIIGEKVILNFAEDENHLLKILSNHKLIKNCCI